MCWTTLKLVSAASTGTASAVAIANTASEIDFMIAPPRSYLDHLSVGPNHTTFGGFPQWRKMHWMLKMRAIDLARATAHSSRRMAHSLRRLRGDGHADLSATL